jgi:prophage regulatory protein
MDNGTDNLIRRKEITEYLGINSSTLYRWRQADDFPKEIVIGPNSIAWHRSSFNRWLKKRTKKN